MRTRNSIFLLLLIPQCFAAKCRICQGDECKNNSEDLLKPCTIFSSTVPFVTISNNNDKESLDYGCLQLEYLEGSFHEIIQKCVMAENLGLICAKIYEKKPYLTCKVQHAIADQESTEEYFTTPLKNNENEMLNPTEVSLASDKIWDAANINFSPTNSDNDLTYGIQETTTQEPKKINDRFDINDINLKTTPKSDTYEIWGDASTEFAWQNNSNYSAASVTAKSSEQNFKPKETTVRDTWQSNESKSSTNNTWGVFSNSGNTSESNSDESVNDISIFDFTTKLNSDESENSSENMIKETNYQQESPSENLANSSKNPLNAVNNSKLNHDITTQLNKNDLGGVATEDFTKNDLDARETNRFQESKDTTTIKTHWQNNSEFDRNKTVEESANPESIFQHPDNIISNTLCTETIKIDDLSNISLNNTSNFDPNETVEEKSRSPNGIFNYSDNTIFSIPFTESVPIDEVIENLSNPEDIFIHPNNTSTEIVPIDDLDNVSNFNSNETVKESTNSLIHSTLISNTTNIESVPTDHLNNIPLNNASNFDSNEIIEEKSTSPDGIFNYSDNTIFSIPTTEKVPIDAPIQNPTSPEDIFIHLNNTGFNIPSTEIVPIDGLDNVSNFNSNETVEEFTNSPIHSTLSNTTSIESVPTDDLNNIPLDNASYFDSNEIIEEKSTNPDGIFNYSDNTIFSIPTTEKVPIDPPIQNPTSPEDIFIHLNKTSFNIPSTEIVPIDGLDNVSNFNSNETVKESTNSPIHSTLISNTTNIESVPTDHLNNIPLNNASNFDSNEIIEEKSTSPDGIFNYSDNEFFRISTTESVPNFNSNDTVKESTKSPFHHSDSTETVPTNDLNNIPLHNASSFDPNETVEEESTSPNGIFIHPSNTVSNISSTEIILLDGLDTTSSFNPNETVNESKSLEDIFNHSYHTISYVPITENVLIDDLNTSNFDPNNETVEGSTNPESIFNHPDNTVYEITTTSADPINDADHEIPLNESNEPSYSTAEIPVNMSPDSQTIIPAIVIEDSNVNNEESAPENETNMGSSTVNYEEKSSEAFKSHLSPIICFIIFVINYLNNVLY